MALLSAQIERLADGGLAEVQPLLPEHWEALGIYRDLMPLDPQYHAYLEREAQGTLAYATLRADGKLVGYWICIVAPGFHYQSTLTATMDILWVKPEWRGQAAGKLLHDCLLKELRRRGVKLWWVGSKSHSPIQGWLESLGFKAEEVMLAKWIGD